jgi:hypothetical protein
VEGAVAIVQRQVKIPLPDRVHLPALPFELEQPGHACLDRVSSELANLEFTEIGRSLDTLTPSPAEAAAEAARTLCEKDFHRRRDRRI